MVDDVSWVTLDADTKGDIFHGALHPDQLYSARPMRGYGDYRSPLPGLYLCGSGSHPGGGVSGAPGHNAAREILRDLSKVGKNSRLGSHSG
jgi:phytoene dehydrogenase-like protein